MGFPSTAYDGRHVIVLACCRNITVMAAVSVLVWSLAVRLTALFLHSVVVILLEQIK